MALTAEQKSVVTTWIAAGDNLSTVQKKLRDEFKVSMTYMDVRFLVDDLNLTLKDPLPKADTRDVSKTPAPKQPGTAPAPLAPDAAPSGAAHSDSGGENLDALPAELDSNAEPAVEGEALPPVGPNSVVVTVDKVTLIPGALAGGSVTFSDGVTGKWVIDQQYRPGFTEISQPGYRPSPTDAQAFMQELSRLLQSRGF